MLVILTREGTTSDTLRHLTWAIVLSVAVLAASVASPAPAQPPYNVGSTTTGAPFTFLDVKTNSIQGIMVDVIKVIAKDAGFAVNVQAILFSALIPSLTTNKIDIISAVQQRAAHTQRRPPPRRQRPALPSTA